MFNTLKEKSLCTDYLINSSTVEIWLKNMEIWQVFHYDTKLVGCWIRILKTFAYVYYDEFLWSNEKSNDDY